MASGKCRSARFHIHSAPSSSKTCSPPRADLHADSHLGSHSDLHSGRARSCVARLARCRLRWPSPRARQTWWLTSKPASSFHLLAALLEGFLRADHRQHAAHSRQCLHVDYIQFRIDGELALMALRTKIIGARYARRAYHREHRLGTLLAILRTMSARVG